MRLEKPTTLSLLICFTPRATAPVPFNTVEHFEAIRSLLRKDGLFCQWLPLYQLDMGTLRVIVRTFLHVYPDASAFLAHYSLKTPMIGLISNIPARAYGPDWLRHRVRRQALQSELRAFRLHSTYALFGGFLAGRDTLADFAGGGPLNTDDGPLVIFEAPHFAYRKQRPAYVRFLSLVEWFDRRPEQVLGPARTASQRQKHRRLAAYWAARNRFLHAGVGVSPTNDVRQLLSQVGAPLLSIVRESPDFEAAYNPLLAMARTLYRVDADAARRLLVALQNPNPLRDEAKRLLGSLSFKRAPD
jgi:spermidine synthase